MAVPPRAAKLWAAPNGGTVCADAERFEAEKKNAATIRKLAEVYFFI
jgi:hypothetical protein